MTDRPIIFSAPMVRALLAGTKVQTRRVVKPQPESHQHTARHIGDGDWQFVSDINQLSDSVSTLRCPYGQPGDRLWVRETWAETDEENGAPVVSYKAGGCIAIGRTAPSKKDYLIHSYAWAKTPEPDRWRPSIHMPRWASRITLEVTGVRVERLQDITPSEAIAEGCPGGDHGDRYAAIEQYRSLWEAINGPGAWDLNQWVWVVEFKRVTP